MSENRIDSRTIFEEDFGSRRDTFLLATMMMMMMMIRISLVGRELR
jgi:hypothetical protein